MVRIGVGLYKYKAAKRYRCHKCGRTIAKRETYYRIKKRFWPIVIRCSNCRPKRSELASGYRRDIITMEEELEEWMKEHRDALTLEAKEELINLLERLIDDAEIIKDELEEKAANIEEYFPYSDTAEMLWQRADYLESAIDLMNNLIDDLEDAQGEQLDIDDVHERIDEIISELIGAEW